MSDTVNKVFEDEFMEVQSGLISLCMEFLGDSKVDKVYAYCSIEGKSYSFNAFFIQNGEVVTVGKIETNMQRAVQFLRTGCHDLGNLKDICVKHEMPVPTEIKMVYDVESGKFDAKYRYDEICTLKTGKSQSQVFMEWMGEIKK